MVWSWSHTSEAYELARKNLGKKSQGWLAVCWAEWKCKHIDKAVEEFDSFLFCVEDPNIEDVITIPDELRTDPLMDGRHDEFVKQAKKIIKQVDKEAIADEIWEWACEQATCENGGYSPWMCPHGCHSVEW